MLDKNVNVDQNHRPLEEISAEIDKLDAAIRALQDQRAALKFEHDSALEEILPRII